jgi:hypothetical protein
MLRYNNNWVITVGAGLTYTIADVGVNEKVVVFTAGTGQVSWSANPALL